MNSCQFVGNMGKDPKFYQGDEKKKSYIMFSLAVKRAFVAKGSDEQAVDWISCKAYGKTAEILHKYVPTGTKVAINARAVQEKWTAEDKTKREAIRFSVEQVTLISQKGDTQSDSGNASTSNYTPNNSAYEDDDDDLPF